MIIPTKKMIAAVLLTVALSAPAIAEPVGGAGGTGGKQVCKTFDIPTIICPPGQTLADLHNNCHAGTVKRTFCHDAALKDVRPSAPGMRELLTESTPQ